MDFETYSSLTNLIYDAVDDDELWPTILADVCSAVNSDVATFDHRTGTGGPLPLLSLHNFDLEAKDAHFEEYATPLSNPALAALLRTSEGSTIDMRSIFGIGEYDRDPAARAILHPQKLNKALTVPLEKTPNSLSFFCVFRTSHQADFEAPETRLVNELSRHMIRSLRMRDVSRATELVQVGANDLLKRNASLTGIMVLSSNGFVLETDPISQNIIDAGAAVGLVGNRLVCLRESAGQVTEDLDRYLRKAHPRDPAFVVRGHGGGDVVVQVLRSAKATDAVGGAGYKVFAIRMLLPLPSSTIQLLQVRYQLTPAETRTVASLIKSRTATDAAAELNISRDTIKSHLARIYDKTGTSSLPQLMLLIGQHG